MTAQQSDSHKATARGRLLRSACATAMLLVCLWGISESARAGYSRLLTQYGQRADEPGAVDTAAQLAPADPEARYARAAMLAASGKSAEALTELEQVVAARPRDYLLWIELANARARAGRREGALAAFEEGIRRAPYYARPRWEFGNHLFRFGLRDRAFAEMGRAAASDPTLLPAMLDLAWQVSGGDARAVEQAVQPQTTVMQIALARFFARRGRTSEAIRLFRAAGGPEAGDRRALVDELLKSKRYNEAYELWSDGKDAGGTSRDPVAALIDGGFERKLSREGTGFGWQSAADTPATRVSLTAAGAHSGAHSLRVEWRGDSDPASTLLSQLVLVEPNTRYKLGFSGRTEGVVTGGLPALIVTDAGATIGELSLPQGTSEWQGYSLEFATGSDARAVLISFQRRRCGSQPCPAFGSLWLDDFSLRKL
jgi:tetratricopeptide (TPR) repeat protein